MKLTLYFVLAFLFSTTLIFSQSGTTTTYTIDVNGTSRTFHVYVPNVYDGSKPVPLMLNIHGWSMSDASQQNMMNYEPIADTGNFIVVRPRGLNSAWSQATTVSSGQADRNFIWNMIDSIKAWHNINPCKVYSSGFSQGSFMSQILVINVDNPSRAPVIAAIGSSSGGISTAGNPSYWDSKNPTHPVPVLHLHGTSDNTISYAGGGTQSPESVDNLMEFWVSHNNCNSTPTMTSCGDIDHYIWDGGDRGTRVEHYKVNGGGHSAPNNSCINSAKVIWEFCSQFCLPYLTSTSCTEVPTISSQPTTTSVAEGNDATFSVTANGCEGTPISYQWQMDTGSGFSDMAESAPYSGVTTNSLTVSSTTAGQDTYQFRVVVSSCCDVATSESATLTVTSAGSAPSITNTKDSSRCGEGTVVLEATASSGTIDWYAAASGGSSLATGTTYTTTSISTTSIYYVDATDGGNTTSTRTAVTATVLNSPTATISGDATICDGQTALISIGLTGTTPIVFTIAKDGINQDTVTVNDTFLPYSYSATDTGIYTVSSLSDNGTCTGIISGSATILRDTLSSVTINDIVASCNPENSKYVISFSIAGGDSASYSVSGTGTLTGNQFVSDSITSGTAYQFAAYDRCSGDTINGNKDCSIVCNASASIRGNDTICANGSDTSTITIDLTGTAPWVVIYKIDGVDQATLSGIMASPYTFTTSTSGEYTLSVVEDNSCLGTVDGTASIRQHTSISSSDEIATCNAANTKYIVAFDITGGDLASYTISGGTGTLSGNHFESDSIVAGGTYEFYVNDIYYCNTDTVSGTKDCSSPACNSTATISGSDTLCDGEIALITIALTGTAPWDVIYKLDGVDQPTLSGIVASPYTFTTSTTGEYTLSVVEDNSCLGTVSGVASIRQHTSINSSDEIATCNAANTKYIIAFDITGGDPASYTVSGGTGTLSGNHFESDSIVAGMAYEFYVNDIYHCNTDTVSGTKDCNVNCTSGYSIVTATDGTICPEGVVTIEVGLSGTAPWSFTYAINGVDHETFTGIVTSPYTFTTSTEGDYTISMFSDGVGCENVLITAVQAKVEINAPIIASALTESCNTKNTKYVVGFDLAGGDMTSYSVTGGTGTLTGNHFESDSINSGVPYSFSLSDQYACSPIVTVNGNKTCSTAGNGCEASATISGDTSICSGEEAILSILFSGTAPWSFAYKIDNGSPVTGTINSSTYTFSTTTAGIYTVSYVSDFSNCVGTSTGSVNLKKHSNPIVGATVSPKDTICSGESVSLNGTGALTYDWSSGVSNGLAFSPFATATYTVTGTDANNCKGSATKAIIIDPCGGVGITENNGIENIRIFPNPTSGAFTIEIARTNFKNLSILIVDVLGTVVHHSAYANLANEIHVPIDVEGIGSGLYYIKIDTGKTIGIRKLIIQ